MTFSVEPRTPSEAAAAPVKNLGDGIAMALLVGEKRVPGGEERLVVEVDDLFPLR